MRLVASFFVALLISLALMHGCDDPILVDAPSDLSLVSTAGLSDGTRATVRHQGTWILSHESSAMPDGETVVIADGAGRWLRDMTSGAPGSLLVTDWYIDADVGDDARDCLSWSTACGDIYEPWRRWGVQQPESWTQPKIHIRGDFSGRSYVLTHATYLAPIVIGETVDMGLPSGTIVSYAAWDGATYQEGIATVRLSDGSMLDVSTYNSMNGYMLRVVGGPRDGLVSVIGPTRGTGAFVSPGGADFTTLELSELAAGDSVQVYRLTPIATQDGATMTIGGGGLTAWNVEIGNQAHSVELETLGGADNGIELAGCILRGADVFAPTWLFQYASAHWQEGTGDLRIYGRLVTSACMFDGIQCREGGFCELSDWTVVCANGLWTGGRDGPGNAQIDGPSLFDAPSPPAMRVDEGTTVYLTSQAWVRGTGSEYGASVEPGSLILYSPGVAPVCIDCTASPWSIGGTSFSALPATNEGASIVQAN